MATAFQTKVATISEKVYAITLLKNNIDWLTADATTMKEVEEYGFTHIIRDDMPEYMRNSGWGDDGDDSKFKTKTKKLNSKWKKPVNNKKNIPFGDNWSEEGKKKQQYWNYNQEIERY